VGGGTCRSSRRRCSRCSWYVHGVARVSPGCRQGVSSRGVFRMFWVSPGCFFSGCLRCLLLLRFQGVLRMSPGCLLLPRPRHAALEEQGAQQVKKAVKERGDSSFLALGERGRLLLPRPRREGETPPPSPQARGGDSSFLALGEEGRLLLPRPRREGETPPSSP
jgi:hypothetical protein